MMSILKKFKAEFFGGALVAASFLFLASTQLASACGLTDVQSCTYTLVDMVAVGVTYLIATIFGIFIALEGWCIGVIMNINANVLNTPFVQTGFSVSLAVANLAFVLGIIVIALATILRNNTYGVKQLLWKLVVMAILVNFGLVIMSPIFAIGNSFTQYFMNCINPTAGGCSGAGSGITSFVHFGETFATAFAPQNAWQIGDISNASGNGLQGAFTAGQNNGITAMIVPILGIGFIAIDMALIFLVLLCFIVLMMIRYLYIAILAILLPFAWASWVFPSFDSHWKKWWNEFLRWTFFAPIVLFFIYLAILTMQSGGVFSMQNLTNTYGPNAAGSTALSAISQFAAGAITPVIMSFLFEIIIGGLIVGGMIAANSMGIKMAGTMTNFAEKQGKKAGSWAWGQSKRRASDKIRTAGRETKYNAATKKHETTTWLQRQGSRLQGVPIWGAKTVGSAIATTGSPEVLHEERKPDIEKYVKENLKGLDDEGMVARANSKDIISNPTAEAAIAQEIAKRNLTKHPNLSSSRMKELLENSEKMGNLQAILNNRPELAAQTSAGLPRFSAALGRMETNAEAEERAIAEAAKKIKVADVTDLDYRSLGDPSGAGAPSAGQQTIALSMSIQQLGKLVAEGNDNQTRAYKDTINKMIAAIPAGTPVPPKLLKLKTYVDTSPAWQYV
ncbi:MAG TPA: hypothetical protein VMA75_05090 [Candidatus Paceibacterota bacterium]|nr:hypothetical protein [Candidatus Paceibacterota bacterium]